MTRSDPVDPILQKENEELKEKNEKLTNRVNTLEAREIAFSNTFQFIGKNEITKTN